MNCVARPILPQCGDACAQSAKQEEAISQLKSTVAEQNATIAQQQRGMEAVTACLNEQAAQIQKVSAQLEASKPAPQVVENNR